MRAPLSQVPDHFVVNRCGNCDCSGLRQQAEAFGFVQMEQRTGV